MTADLTSCQATRSLVTTCGGAPHWAPRSRAIQPSSMITRWKAGSDRRRLRRRRLAPPGADPVALDDGMNGVVAERAAPAGRHLGGLFMEPVATALRASR